MIQELLGGNNNNNPGFILGGGERKMFSFGNGGGILQATPTTVLPHHHHHQSTLVVSPSPPPPPSLSSSSSTPSSTAATAAANTTTTTTTNTSSSSNSNNNNPENNQVRCPRCDSANTKFCYYNNYNLTQPRHFCKTCRRYWTKGGALRNVPIGGGCRKNKSPLPPAPAAASKPKPATSASPATEIAGAHHSHLSPASPILWGSPQSSHLLALLRSANYPSPSQNPNPNPSPGLADNCMIGASLNVKEEGGSNLGRGLGLDPVGHVPSLGLCSSFWRSSSSSQQQNGFALGDHQQGASGNGGVQELYQRLRSSPGSGFYGDQTAVVLTHHAGSSSVLESAPVNGGELGFWNNNNNNNTAFSWSDLQASTTTNGAYP